MNFARKISLDRAAVGVVSIAAAGVVGEAAARTSLGDAQGARECRYPPLSSFLKEEHVRELEENSIVVIHNVLPSSALQQARKNVESLSKRIQTANHSNDSDVRQDQILSIRESDNGADGRSEHGDTLIHCIKMLRGVPFLLARHGYTASHSHIVPQQCQLAMYKPDGLAAYVRHLDRCDLSIGEMGLVEWLRASDYRHRVVTAILYLNDPDWSGGGELRVFRDAASTGAGGDSVDEDGDAEYSDIVPSGGKLILFDSSRVEHQVLPSYRQDRYALTCWVNGRLA